MSTTTLTIAPRRELARRTLHPRAAGADEEIRVSGTRRGVAQRVEGAVLSDDLRLHRP